MSAQKAQANAGLKNDFPTFNAEWVKAFSNSVIEATRCNERLRIFSLNGLTNRNQSIIDQQRRASNLAWILARRKIVTRTKRVVIVGGSFAGLTCAVGLSLKTQCPVVVLDKEPVLLSRFKWAAHRYLHPELRSSAFAADPSRGHTDLPVLNWNANYAPTVVTDIEAKFRAYCKSLPIHLRLGWEVTSVEEKEDWRVVVQGVDQPELAAHVVIIAAGFGNERALPGLPDSSYWYSGVPSSYKSRYRSGSKRERVAIAGNGDSGLIELFHYAIRDFRQEEMSGLFASRQVSNSIILDIDDAKFTKIQNLDPIPPYNGYLDWYLGYEGDKSARNDVPSRCVRKICNLIERRLRREKVDTNYRISAKTFQALNIKIGSDIAKDLELLASVELAKIFATNARTWCIDNPMDFRELESRINRSFNIVVFGRSRTVFNTKQSPRNQLLLAMLVRKRAFKYESRDLHLEEQCEFNNGLYKVAGKRFERVVVRLGTAPNSFQSKFGRGEGGMLGTKARFPLRSLAPEMPVFYLVPEIDLVRKVILSSARARAEYSKQSRDAKENVQR